MTSFKIGGEKTMDALERGEKAKCVERVTHALRGGGGEDEGITPRVRGLA